ncbi:MAG: agmatinase [Aminipila sp.]
MNRNIQTFLGCENEYEDSSIVVFGAPFDGTTSYRPGTRFASAEMRKESFGIETYSPYQDRDLEDIEIFDGGDLEIGFGNTEKALKTIEDFTAKVIKDDKIPLMIGGEHLVTLGAVRAVAEKYPDLHIIHFDAHADLREEYMEEKLSHATVLRRVYEIVGEGKIFQFGIRSGEKKEFEFAKKHTAMCKFNFNGLSDVVNSLKNKPVYFTLDLDVLDSSVFPGTGTPEAGGVTFKELMEALLMLQDLNIVGCDINELSPMLDTSGASTAVACKVLREVLLLL